MPRSVGARELKTRLGSYLRLVRAGQMIIVTDRGVPVAELRPVSPANGDRDAILAELAALGRVTLPSGRPLAPFRPVAIRGTPLSETILDDRDDRV